MLRRLTLHTLRSLALGILAGALLVIGAHLCGPSVESGPSAQSSQTRTLDYAYWANYHSSSGRVQRQRADRSGPVTTIASGSTDAYQPQDLVIDGDYALLDQLSHQFQWQGAATTRRRNGLHNHHRLRLHRRVLAPVTWRSMATYVYWTNYTSQAPRTARCSGNERTGRAPSRQSRPVPPTSITPGTWSSAGILSTGPTTRPAPRTARCSGSGRTGRAR